MIVQPLNLSELRDILQREHKDYNVDITNAMAFGSGVIVCFHILPRRPNLAHFARIAFFETHRADLRLSWNMPAGEP